MQSPLPLWWWLVFVLDLAMWIGAVLWIQYMARKTRGE